MSLKFQKLTRPNIRKLEAGQKIIENGISFERLINGDGRYSVNIMVDGQRVHRVVGQESDGVTRKQVEGYIEQTKTDARNGRLNLPKGRKTALGFKQAGNQYLSRLDEEGGKDLKAKRMRLNEHLIPFFKDQSLTGIVTFEIERYKKFRSKEKAAPGTINRELAVISHLFNKAIEWKWISHRPAVIKRLKEDAGRIIYLVPEQIERLTKAAMQDQNPHVYPFIVIGLETAMRRMEILSIRIRDIDLGKRVIFIPQAKSGARNQPITNSLAEFIKGYLEIAEPGQEWLFPSISSKTGHSVAIEKAFKRAVKNAGLNPKEVVRHTLRHTAITHLVQAGVDLPTVKRISGHKTLAMVERYSHQNGEHIQTAMDKLEERIHGKKPSFSGTITQELHKKKKRA
jgi:integrase